MAVPTSPATARMRPAEAVRRILASVFRRRSITPPGPDDGLPSPPDPRPIVPDLHEAEEWLFDRVDELAARGALDDGHGDLFDPLVDDVVSLWGAGQTQHHHEHVAHLARLDRTEIDLDAVTGWVRRKADAADAAVVHLDSEIARLLAAVDEEDQLKREIRRQRRTVREQRRDDRRRRRDDVRRLRHDLRLRRLEARARAREARQ